MKEKNQHETVKFWQTFRKDEPLVVMSFKPALIGVFTNEEALQNALNIKSITSVYTPLNEVKKDVLSSLPKNELGKMTTGCGISAKDIKTLSHLFVDIDVVGLQDDGKKRNATEDEHEEARQVALNAKTFLSNAGFPSPILIDSANGFHLLYQIDLKATKESEKIIANVLKAVAEQADTEKAKIDTVVFDKGRKVKMPGSSNNADEENCRMSTIIEVPNESIVVPSELLEEVAKLCKNEKEGWKNSKSKMLTIEEGMAEIAEQAGDLLAFELGIERANKLYPRHAASLSMRLNSLTSMLEQAGITFHIKPSATYKQITIKNKNSILKKKPKPAKDLETDIDKELGL